MSLQGSEDFNKTVDEYVRVVVQRRWWLLLPACLVALGTVGVSLLFPDIYRSATLILVEHQKVPEHYVVSNVSSDLRSRLRTMTQQILSRTHLLRIIEEFDLYREEKSKRSPEELVESMRRDIELELLEGDSRRDELSAFTISFSAKDPRVAQQIVSRLTSLFIEENLKAREQQSVGTTEFLRIQLDNARQVLQEQEKRLTEFRMRYLGELPGQHTSNLQILAGLQMRLQTTAAALNRAREHRIYLEALLEQYKRVAEGEGEGSLPGSRRSPAKVLAEGELARLRTKRAALLARYTSKHPDILKVGQEIAKAKALLAELSQEEEEKEKEEKEKETESDTSDGPPTTAVFAQVQSQLQANQAEINNLLDEEKGIRQKIQQYEQRLNLTPLREQQMADVVRDYNLSRQNYEELLKKKLESELATSLERRQQGEQFRILDPASLPIKPYSPNRPRMNLLGGALGLGAALGLACLAEMRDRSLHTEKELVRLIPQPLVVGLPELLTVAEQRRRWWKRCGEWIAGSLLVLAVVAGEFFVYWQG